MFLKKKKRFLLALVMVFLFIGFLAIGCSESQTADKAEVEEEKVIELTDESGRNLKLPFPLQKVVVVNAYNVEFVRALAGTEAIVGMDDNSAKYEGYWPGYSKENNVGKNQSELNYEKIISLKPQALIIPRNGAWEEAEKQLKPFDIPVVVITGWDVTKHVSNIETLGKMFDQPEKANTMAEFYNKYNNLVAERLKNVDRKKVYLENWAKPYISPIPGSGHHDMIENAGGKNIFDDIVFADQPSAKGSVHDFEIDPERILTEDPDVIIKYNNGNYVPLPFEEQIALLEEMAGRPGWSNLKAVKSGNVHTISNFAAGASSKTVGMVYIAKWLYPELMQDIDPDQAHREWIETIQGVPSKDHYVVSITDK